MATFSQGTFEPYVKFPLRLSQDPSQEDRGEEPKSRSRIVALLRLAAAGIEAMKARLDSQHGGIPSSEDRIARLHHRGGPKFTGVSAAFSASVISYPTVAAIFITDVPPKAASL